MASSKDDYLEHRVTVVEGVLGGTLAAPGLVHVQKQIAETVYGKKGKNGLVGDVNSLKMDRVRGLAWIAGAAAAGGSVPLILGWLLKITNSH